jgi:hypothetical protein
MLSAIADIILNCPYYPECIQEATVEIYYCGMMLYNRSLLDYCMEHDLMFLFQEKEHLDWAREGF